MLDVSWPFDQVEENSVNEKSSILLTTVASLESKRAVPLVTQPAVGKETQKLWKINFFPAWAFLAQKCMKMMKKNKKCCKNNVLLFDDETILKAPTNPIS